MKHFIAVLALCLSVQAQSIKSVQVLGSSVGNDGVILHLKNRSAIPLVGIMAVRGSVREEDLALQPAQKIMPGQLFDFSFPGSASPGEEVEIRALLFENGLGEGDTHLVRVMAARLEGSKASARAVIQALSEETNHERLLQKLEASPGVRGSVSSVAVPSQSLALLPLDQRQEIVHSYAAGYLGTKERAIFEVKKLDKSKEDPGLKSLNVSPFEALRLYLGNVLEVGRSTK